MSVASTEPLVLVHDYLLVLRGAERTFAALSDLWPESPILTLLYDERGTAARFAGHPITSSLLQRTGARQTNFRKLFPLLGWAARRMPSEDYRCIISSSSAFAHGVSKGGDARHVSYCHSPFRYAWHEQAPTLRDMPAPLRPAVALLLNRHRAFDRRAAAQVDQFVANSQLTRERIARFWGRDSVVVHPPVDVERFHIGDPEDYVLFVGEFVRHKRAEVAIQAAAAAGRRIKLVGAGPDLARLSSLYKEAEFLGRIGDEELASLYARAAALIVPTVEEFGIAAVEAQAAGRPVVALAAGGALETVIHGCTGLLVDPGDPSGFARALRQDLHAFDPQEIRAHAQSFSREAFQARMHDVVAEVCR
jgi:glycosyltransferase involved in cell wall biosynthesis